MLQKANRPLFKGDPKDFPSFLKAIEVEVAAETVTISLKPDGKDAKTVNGSVLLGIIFMGTRLKEIPGPDDDWTKWDMQQLIDATEAELGPIPSREQEAMIDIEATIGEHIDTWSNAQKKVQKIIYGHLKTDLPHLLDISVTDPFAASRIMWRFKQDWIRYQKRDAHHLNRDRKSTRLNSSHSSVSRMPSSA